MGEHGWIGHASPSLLEPGIRIPLIIRYPPVFQPGMVVSDPVSIIDIFPTIVAVLGSEDAYLEDQLQGFSLLPESFASLEDRFVIIESLDRHVDVFRKIDSDFDLAKYEYIQRALRWRDYKYIHKSESPPELYQVIRDPGERVNLSSTESDVKDCLQCKLDEWLSSFEAYPVSSPGNELELSEEVRRCLIALGYMEF